MRLVLASLCALLVCSLASRAVAGGTIDIQTTSVGNLIVVDVTVNDNGGAGSCNGFFTLRRWMIPDCNAVTLGAFARQPGVVSTHRFFDALLPASRAFRYDIVSCSGFTWTGDCGWGLPIQAVATTGPAPAYLGKGQLAGTFSFESCPDECAGAVFFDVPPDVWPYVASGVNVALYGGFAPNCQHGWALVPTQAVPTGCTVAIETPTWSQAKSLYR